MNDRFGLEEGTAKLGQEIIRFSQSLKITIFNEALVKQLKRSGSSIGANYREEI